MNNSNFISLLSLSFDLYIQYKNSIQALYRAAVEDVPDDDYMIPLGKAEIMRSGTDCTVVGWGGQLRVLEKACDMALADHGISCELIDLRTILPWDADCVLEAMLKSSSSACAELCAGQATFMRLEMWKVRGGAAVFFLR